MDFTHAAPSFPSVAFKTAHGSGPSVQGQPVATDMSSGMEGTISRGLVQATEHMGLTPAREVRQTSDRPVPEKSDRPIEPVSGCLHDGNLTTCEEVRQTSDRPVPTKSDRHVTNPFTPNLYINLDIPTARGPAPAHIHAGAASVVQVLTEQPAGHQPVRPAGGTDPARIRGAVQDTLPNPRSVPPEVPLSRVRQNLDSRLVTVAVDDDSGVSVQVSPAFAAKHPDRLRELREIFSACAAGVAQPDFEPLPADLPAGIGDGHEGGLQ